MKKGKNEEIKNSSLFGGSGLKGRKKRGPRWRKVEKNEREGLSMKEDHKSSNIQWR